MIWIKDTHNDYYNADLIESFFIKAQGPKFFILFRLWGNTNPEELIWEIHECYEDAQEALASLVFDLENPCE